MTHAERIISLLLEDDAPSIRGEYWIIDGDAWFSDGDIGDVNHEGRAIQHAAMLMMEHFDGKEDEFYEEDQIKDAAVKWLYEDHGIEATDANWKEAVVNQFKIEDPTTAEEMAEVFYCALQFGDARDVAMKWWGWIWVRGTNIGVWTFTADDRSSVLAGLHEIISQEGEEDVDYSQMEITIGVGATGKRYSMTMAELESGRTPSTDPTWGRPTESQEDEENLDPALADMGRHVAMISTNRKMQPGEEVSRGTLQPKDLIRRTLEKLKEIHYEGWKEFMEREGELIAALDVEGASDKYPNEPPLEDFLWDILVQRMNNDYVPFGCHFGSNEGSAADVGCWVSEDYLQEPGTEESVTTWDISDPQAQGFLSGEEEPITPYVLINSGNERAVYSADGELIWRC